MRSFKHRVTCLVHKAAGHMRDHLPKRTIAVAGQSSTSSNRQGDQTHPEIVTVLSSDGCEIPALTLTPELMVPLQGALRTSLARRIISKESKNHEAYLDGLADRLRKQVYQLDGTLTATLQIVPGGETAEALRDMQYGLLRDLSTIDERKQEVKEVEEDLEIKQLYPAQDPLRIISEVLEKHGLLDFDIPSQLPKEPPFDMRMLKHMEAHGADANLGEKRKFPEPDGSSHVGSHETNLSLPRPEPISDDVFKAEEQLYQIYKTMIRERAEVRHLAAEIDAQRSTNVDAEPTMLQRAIRSHPDGLRGRLEDCWYKIDSLRHVVTMSGHDWPLHDKVLEDEEVVRECGWWARRINDLSSESEALRKRKQNEEIAARLSEVQSELDPAFRKYNYLRTQCRRRGVDYDPHRGLSGQQIIDLVFDQSVAADRALYEARQALQAEIIARQTEDPESDKQPRGAYVQHIHREVATKRRILYEARLEMEKYTDEAIWASFGGLLEDSDDETRSNASETSGYGQGPLPGQADCIKSLPGLAARAREPIWQRWRHFLGPFGRKSGPQSTPEVASILEAGSDSISVRHPEEEGLDGKTDQSVLRRWQYIAARNGRDVAKYQISTLDLGDMFTEKSADP